MDRITLSYRRRSRAKLALAYVVLICLLLVMGCSKPVREAAKVDNRPTYAQNDSGQLLDRSTAKAQRELTHEEQNEAKLRAAAPSESERSR
jgi:hypothetical protein